MRTSRKSPSRGKNNDFATLAYPQIIARKNRDIDWQWCDLQFLFPLLSEDEKTAFHRQFKKFYPNGIDGQNPPPHAARNAVRCLALIFDKPDKSE